MLLVKNKGLLFVLMALVFVITSCETNRNEIMALGKKTVMPDLTGKDVTMLYSDSTVLKIKLQTPQMQKYTKGVKEAVTIMPKGVFVIFYDEKGKEATTLKADYGVRYEASKRMEVKYNVEVINVNGEKLNTEHLVWDEKRKKIISDAFVKITTAKEIIMGKGLESNQDFTQYEIKEITGSIRIDDKQL
ncbi:MAG: LPS export ABC transporter periplasmic protein LptC [Bacteroidetes bacterium]|nr:LPS export ABC transporter periplasmic protein LptC [Bacteroidota bacterium]